MMEIELNVHELVAQAATARERAYAPYSHFLVGAALLTKSGRIYTGANVENASYSVTICAERVALFSAVAAGEREFVALAVVTDAGVSPCGACRQALREFSANLRVFIADAAGHCREHTLAELLPDAFVPDDLPH